ncbi:MAG: hypothetical protein EPO52_06245 [Herbiconiux sp.]|uniref:Ig-like domain-containing protein n=1 Tax=Herbiconiux sp. TaxID=1871186 RepID=UPI00121C42FD|nr:Ig-like domain-containing protein [Herbiconiux sp.]TAJ48823.1 MAG: hypothetical protein EPO52_06245 [Herbiconiux sp.]
MSALQSGGERTASHARGGAHRRSRIIAVGLLLALAAVTSTAFLGLGAGSAVASTTPAPPSESAAPNETVPPAETVSPAPPPAPPVIDTPVAGELLSGTFSVSGTATPGSTVQILPPGSSEPLCIVTADDAGAWSCAVRSLDSAQSATVRVVELVPGGDDVSSSVTVRVLNAPVVTGGPRGSLTNAVVQGTAFPGATVTASASGYDCTATADASGAWSCPLARGIEDGPHVVSATQTTSWSSGVASPASAPVAITVDVTVPAAPQVLSPASGAVLPLSGAVFSGAGEDGATVSVFAGAGVLCESPVANGAWSCATSAVPAGRYTVSVLQQDAAGNVSVQSSPLTIDFQAAASTPPSAAPTPAPGTSAAATPAPSATGAPAPSGSATDPGTPVDPDPDAPSAPDQPGPSAPTPAVPGSEPPGAWTESTQFTASLQPAIGGQAGSLWWLALAAAAAALLLVALPARLLSGAVESAVAGVDPHSPAGARSAPESALTRIRRGLASLLGRNRSRHDREYDRAPDVTLTPAVKIAAAVLTSAAIVTLSGPVLGQPAYLRLYVAVVVAVVVVNLAATLLPGLLARRAFGIPSTARLQPSLLLVSAVLALASRVGDIQPALVFGIVGALTVAATTRQSDRGRLGTVQVLCLLVTGAAGWMLAGALGSAESPELWSTALREFSNVVALSSFGGAAVLLLPFGRSCGRRILDWSPATWVLLTVAAFAALAMLFVPALIAAAADGELLVLGIAVAAFAAVSLSVWVWMRFVAVEDDLE